MTLANELLKDLGQEITEAMDLEKAIQALVDTPASDKNDDQGKFVQLLKGLAFSEDPQSDKFMKKLMKMVDDRFLLDDKE